MSCVSLNDCHDPSASVGMTNATSGGGMLANRSIPRCTVIPELAYADMEQAVAWLCEAFGFTLRIVMGSHRAQLNVGDGAVVLTEQAWGTYGHWVMVRVEDVDRHCE